MAGVADNYLLHVAAPPNENAPENKQLPWRDKEQNWPVRGAGLNNVVGLNFELFIAILCMNLTAMPH